MSQDILRCRIESAINETSAESESDTPDFILAEYLMDCLRAFDAAVSRRTDWYEESNPPALEENTWCCIQCLQSFPDSFEGVCFGDMTFCSEQCVENRKAEQ